MPAFNTLTESELGELGECLTQPMLERILHMRYALDQAENILRAVAHTLTVHGHIDHDTHLHERVTEAVS